MVVLPLLSRRETVVPVRKRGPSALLATARAAKDIRLQNKTRFGVAR